MIQKNHFGVEKFGFENFDVVKIRFCKVRCREILRYKLFLIKFCFCLSEKMQKEMIFQRSENNDVETKNAISNVLIKIHDKKSYLNLLQLQERNLAQIILLVPRQK
jgi:hypothetical protein